MTQRIFKLPPEIAEKIAAGEVVERPSSVVKELVENSLDAKSSRIEIFLEEGGKTLIRIQDDGEGMSPRELKLAIERHATSKVQAYEDLFQLASLGFRGEALPSIAAVSRFTLKSRPRGAAPSETGYEIALEGGRLIAEREVGHPWGTSVEIRDLFFNTPARLKFLKSQQTEWGHIESHLSALALAYPEVQWIARHNGKERIRWVQRGLAQRMIEVWGREAADQFYPFFYEQGGLCLSGFLGHPNLSQFQPGESMLCVNQRPVKDRLLQHAITTGYRSLLMKEASPLVVLFLKIPPAELDVNVHPTKREVKFANPNLVHHFVAESIRDFLSKAPWKGSSREMHSENSEREKNTRLSGPRFLADFSSTPGREQTSYPSPSFPARDLREEQQQWSKSPLQEGTDAPPSPPVEKKPEQTQTSFFKAGRLPYQALRLIGQLKKTYLLCESEEHFVLIDQHAAHERIGFEALRQAHKAGSMASQGLVIPEIVELKPVELEALEPFLPQLAQFGLEIEAFGPSSIAIKAVPAVLEKVALLPLIRELIEDFKQHGSSKNLEERTEELFALMACHRQIRAGDELSTPEMQKLLHQLDEGAYSYHCPHGRPVMVQIPFRELEKWFKRVL